LRPSAVVEVLVLLSLMLRRDEWKIEPTGLRGSGSANEWNELWRLGMMMGSSSEDSSSSENCQLARLLRLWVLWLREIGLSISSSVFVIVDSARARPWESIVNLTEARALGCGKVSGIEASSVRRCWFFSGDDLPEGRTGLLLGSTMLPPLALRATGASGAVEPRPNPFLPRFSLKLRPRPGLVDPLTGELASARSGILPFLPFMSMVFRRVSPDPCSLMSAEAMLNAPC
jgi:hypothetical protein